MRNGNPTSRVHLEDGELSRSLELGHGLELNFEESRYEPQFPVEGNASLHFGPVPDVPNNDPGDYNWPGGAHGTLESHAFSLAGYAASDKPVLYFNYWAGTEQESSDPATQTPMLDSLRVLCEWTGELALLATGFGLRFLALAGFGPRLDACARCGSSALRGKVRFCPEEGGVVCADCTRGTGEEDDPVPDRLGQGASAALHDLHELAGRATVPAGQVAERLPRRGLDALLLEPRERRRHVDVEPTANVAHGLAPETAARWGGRGDPVRREDLLQPGVER